MHAVILAAGEGSRLEDHSGEVPKAFVEIAGRTLYDRQRAAIDGHVDRVTVVLGYAYEQVVDRITDAETVIFEEWRDYENAESLRRAIRGIDDDVLILNGDIIVTESVVDHVVRRKQMVPDRCVVATYPGIQEGETAIQCDDQGIVTDYGLIPGHRHTGMGIIDSEYLATVESYLAANKTEWYPGLYTHVPTEMVTISPDQHIEINYPRDMILAQNKLPFETTDEQNIQT